MAKNARTEVVAIGEALVELGSTAGPLDTKRLGDLLDRVARIYGLYINGNPARKAWATSRANAAATVGSARARKAWQTRRERRP